jgi:SAM-dependent methyltransferase
MKAETHRAKGGARETVIWHDVECGGFEADLALWEELAQDGEGQVLELGCGTGRVAIHLAARGHDVTGIDSDPALIAELRRRASAAELVVRAETADAGGFDLDRRFGLVLAPMQLIQLLTPAARRGCLRATAAHLTRGGTAALAIVETPAEGIPPSPPLPDVRELDGRVYSSLPLGVSREGESLLVARLRQTVDPDGHLEERRNAVRLHLLSAAQLEEEARAAGLRPAGRRRIEATAAHVGSTVVLVGA